jgi:hypothetical protein
MSRGATVAKSRLSSCWKQLEVIDIVGRYAENA